MPVYELQGVKFENKGAELMLLASVEHLTTKRDIDLAVPFRIGNFAQRRAAGARHLISLHRPARMMNGTLATAMTILPGAVKRVITAYGENDMSGLIDASGFRYSDQWPISSLKAQVTKAKKYKDAGKPVIYLPQAFGPFKSDAAKSFIAQVISHSDLVFARDQVSFDYLTDAAGHLPQITLAPDFTNLVAPKPGVAIPANTLFIVPNARMMDKTSSETGARYISSLALAVTTSRSCGFEPIIMIHDAHGDRVVARQVQEIAGGIIRELSHPDPRVLKYWLAQARGVVGSRFHALVSALSAGTPVIAMGWSHKYGELMADYGQSRLNLSADDRDTLSNTIKSWSDDAARREAHLAIVAASEKIKSKSRQMWNAVDAVLTKKA